MNTTDYFWHAVLMFLALLGSVLALSWGAYLAADLNIMQGLPFHVRYLMVGVTTIFGYQLYQNTSGWLERRFPGISIN